MHIYEAGPVSFLRTILIILLVYYAFRFIARYIFPLFFKRMVSNLEKKVNEQQGGRTAESQRVREGETVIDMKPQQPKESSKDVGEYIDYEEID